MRERGLFENLKILLFLAVMCGVYLVRYFSHQTVVSEVEEYYETALYATGFFYLLLFILFILLLKKTGRYGPVLCLMLGAISFAPFLQINTLGGIYLFLAMIFVLMAIVCVWGRFFFLLIPLFAAGVYLYPGFFLLGAPMILGAIGYQSKLRPVNSWIIFASIIAGGYFFYMGIHSEVPLWEDEYGILAQFHPYMEFAGMMDEELVHTAKVLELIVFSVLISPYIYMYLRLLHDVGWKPKYLSFLLAGVLPLTEYISQEHPGQVMYFILVYYLFAVILPIAWGDAVWVQALDALVSRVRRLPGYLVLLIYPMCLFPLRRGIICLASRWIVNLIMFKYFGAEV